MFRKKVQQVFRAKCFIRGLLFIRGQMFFYLPWAKRFSQIFLVMSFGFYPLLACGQRANNPPTANTGFSFIAIGDAGEKNSLLKNNAKAITALYQNDRFNALFFLGDNFYMTGLNFNDDKDPREETPKRIKEVLGPFHEVMAGLGRANVHAVAGNHDYYAKLVIDKSYLFGLISLHTFPIGITTKGNQRADSISSWTYHYALPEEVVFPINREAQDSLQIIFFDSAILLRTPPQTWRRYFAGLQSLLAATKNRPHIKWRLLAAHHPLYSVGEHGGYSEWDPETRAVHFLNHCDADSDVVDYYLNTADPEDLCAPRYRAYRDSLMAAIRQSEVRVQLFLAGHDHSLQLLSYPQRDPECPTCPKIHLVSGAGAKASRVKAAAPSRGEYTFPEPQLENRGDSQYGFARVDIQPEMMRVRFFSGSTKKEILVTGGVKEFWIKPDGTLETK